jgi:hypothetical protein
MNVVHLIYMHYLLVLDRHKSAPYRWRRSDGRDSRSSTGFHRQGYHQQSGLKCTGLRTIMRKAGLPWDAWRVNESVMEASVFIDNLSLQCDGVRGMRRDPGGFYRPAWEVRISPHLGETYSSSSLSRGRQG